MTFEERVEFFLNEVQELMLRLNISISHEDQHGKFILEPYSPINYQWLVDADINNETPEQRAYASYLEEQRIAEIQRNRGLIA